MSFAVQTSKVEKTMRRPSNEAMKLTIYVRENYRTQQTERGVGGGVLATSSGTTNKRTTCKSTTWAAS